MEWRPGHTQNLYVAAPGDRFSMGATWGVWWRAARHAATRNCPLHVNRGMFIFLDGEEGGAVSLPTEAIEHGGAVSSGNSVKE